MEQGLAASRTRHPGRRSARVFQRLGSPTHLMGLSEWSDEAAFERFRLSPAFAEGVAASGPPPRIERLEPLLRFERIEERVGVVGCSTIVAAPENVAAVEAYLRGAAHRETTGADGLIRRELFRTCSRPDGLLVVHSWRSLADLEQYRALYSARDELARLGAGAERFTGRPATEFSVYAR